MEPNEAFVCREDDNLYFPAWYEDPDYREEVVIHKCSAGDVVVFHILFYDDRFTVRSQALSWRDESKALSAGKPRLAG